ncbi:MAG: hypothetical protein E7279_04455 [Lachnospiraceae bacterium]|nr:hypothetical protein [Lachnospiraceae bacterium]
MMKKGSLLVALVITAIAITACSCQSESTNNATSNVVNDNTTQEVSVSDNGQVSEDMKMSINGTMVNVAWEQNESVEALKQLTAEKPLTINMSMYGGFEQVGSIGQNLPKNDVQTTTSAGDIVLYSGNQIVVFYGSNSWAYTRLGKITDKSASQMRELLGNGDVTITFTR